MSDFIVGTMQAGSSSSILKFDAAGKKIGTKKEKGKKTRASDINTRIIKR